MTGNLTTIEAMRTVLRERRQSLAASLQSTLRQLEGEPMLMVNDEEIQGLLLSLEAARDALLVPVATKGERRAEKELERTEGLHALGDRRAAIRRRYRSRAAA